MLFINILQIYLHSSHQPYIHHKPLPLQVGSALSELCTVITVWLVRNYISLILQLSSSQQVCFSKWMNVRKWLDHVIAADHHFTGLSSHNLSDVLQYVCIVIVLWYALCDKDTDIKANRVSLFPRSSVLRSHKFTLSNLLDNYDLVIECFHQLIFFMFVLYNLQITT